MGASDSKLVFKKGIFRLSEERHIPADDPYWASFWELPESTEDIFSLFAPADIRRTRDRALENIETLVVAVTARLFLLRHHPSFPDAEIAPERHALNCVRVLTRILPYLYELDLLQTWEEKFFWSVRKRRTRKAVISSEVLFDESQLSPTEALAAQGEFEDAKPLGEELIDTLIDLLFFADFTSSRPGQGKPKVTYAIWQSGVGCNASVPTTKEYESNRSEILRLLLTLSSQSMYMSPGILPQRGVRALTHMCSCPDKQVVLSVLCSLLNTTMKYNPASWRVPYNALVFKDPKQALVTYALQFLLVLLLYPIPEQSHKNYYRHFLGRLHRPQDFQFIVDGMTRILNQPLQANASYIPSTQGPTKFAPEIIMLFWEITQCNKRFRSFIVDTERAHDFVILVLFYALEYKSDGSKQGVVRMCAFLLQTLSVEPNFGINLNKNFEAQDTLPPAIRIPGFRGTYGDFLIQSIYNLITTSQGKLTAIYPALLAVINNIAPYLKGISATTSARLMQLLSSMSSPSFLLANETNHDLLRSLLESLNSIIEHQYQKNPEFVLAVLKNRKRIDSLRNFTLESGQEEIERRNRRRKDTTGSASDPLEAGSNRNSLESLASPTTPHSRTPNQHLHPLDEDSTFAIGDDEDDEDDDEVDSDDDTRPTPAQSIPSENPSRASSVASSNRRHNSSSNAGSGGGGVEDAVPTQLRGMSEKARGKMPAGAHSFSRQNSTTSLGSHSGVGGGAAAVGVGGVGVGVGGGSVAVMMMGSGSQSGHFEPTARWIDSWLPELPLHTLLTLTQQLTALLPRQALAAASPSSSATVATEEASSSLLSRIRGVKLLGVDASDPRVHSFEWSPLALGWYESLVWSFVFSAELQSARGSAGVWNATAIKLFRVMQDTAPPQGPSLASPRGAVDAVGSNIVSRIGSINLRGAAESIGAAASGVAGGGGGAEREREREQSVGRGAGAER